MFFFKQKTAYEIKECDWSSDVCSSDLALIVDDPDAPVGLFTHWIVWNIDPQTNRISEGTTPSGAVQGKNDFGDVGYGGPPPPSRTHRYFFKVFALDQALNL